MSIRTLFENIADAIKEKNPDVVTVTPEQMPQAIRDITGGTSFEVSTYSEYLTRSLDTGVNINTGNTVEISFYANAYQNDGHIIGNPTNSFGTAFHLTTYSNKWFGSNGTSEFNFNATDDYPLYGADIKYRLEPDGKVYLNDIHVMTSTNGTNGTRYALNTRGGGVSTTGIYKYKYVKIWNSNNELIYDLEFGKFDIGTTIIYMAHEKISDTYFAY